MVVTRLLGALREAADRQGLAVLIVEQQARRALAVADDWHLLSRGSVVESGLADEGAQLEAAYLASMSATTHGAG
jgi:branched-chain amino acid transport system ATP-binding protein